MSVLQTIDLKKYYGTKPNITRALDGVNFSVEDGEFVAIVGTSGSGKSTLLHMMGGLDTPTSGNVIVRDKELSKMNDEQLTIFRRRNIGFIFQNYKMCIRDRCSAFLQSTDFAGAGAGSVQLLLSLPQSCQAALLCLWFFRFVFRPAIKPSNAGFDFF